jgi:hypothetical protein
MKVFIECVAQPGSVDPSVLPAALALRLDNGLRTPCSVALPKGSTYLVTFSRPGYRTAVASIKTQPSAWYYANAFFPLGLVLLMPIDLLFDTGTVLAPHDLFMRMDILDAPSLSYARDGPSTGSTFDVWVRWPSGPDAAYLVLAMASRPPTELGGGALERFAAAAPVSAAWGALVTGLSGCTNGRGMALVRLEVPDDPALVGATLYLVCIGLGEDLQAFRSDPCELTVGARRGLGIGDDPPATAPIEASAPVLRTSHGDRE